MLVISRLPTFSVVGRPVLRRVMAFSRASNSAAAKGLVR